MIDRDCWWIAQPEFLLDQSPLVGCAETVGAGSGRISHTGVINAHTDQAVRYRVVTGSGCNVRDHGSRSQARSRRRTHVAGWVLQHDAEAGNVPRSRGWSLA